MAERSQPIKICVSSRLSAVTFSASGEHLVSGDDEGVQVWQVKNGQRAASMEAKRVSCLVVSKDGRWIAAGTRSGYVFMWDAKTDFKQVLTERNGDDSNFISAVDFSPDSTQWLVVSWDYTATIRDVATLKQVRKLVHASPVKNGGILAKYSPHGDRITTATISSLRVWDSNTGHLLVDIPVTSHCLAWSREHLFVISDKKIKKFEASTGSAASEWPVPNSDYFSCIALPEHSEFIACSTKDIVTFWDSSTGTQLGLIQHPQQISSLAFSPDDRLLAVGGLHGNIIIKNFENSLFPLYCTAPFLSYTDNVLDSWRHGRLAEAEVTLTQTISTHQNHRALANRALVRSRLQYSDLAIDDAEKSIENRPSVIGYIAKSIALIASGQKEDGCRVFDLAFMHCHPTDVDRLLLIKAVVLFMAGKHDEAVLRVGDLIDTVQSNAFYYVVQAYMYLLLGKSCMESGDYEGAIRWFERARVRMPYHARSRLLVISLISGWDFNDLGLKIQQYLCKVLYAAGRIDDAGKCLLELVNASQRVINGRRSDLKEWISNFARKCLSKQVGVLMLQTALSSPTQSTLLTEWAKATLASHSWKDALVSAAGFVVSRSTVYRVIYEGLETMELTSYAGDCFHQLVGELIERAGVHDEQLDWVLGKLVDLGDADMSSKLHGSAISRYSEALALNPAVPQLLIKRSKAYAAGGLWEEVLNDANKVIELDPLSPWGYERKHAALHKMGDYKNAINEFEEMLSKMSHSSDPGICDYHRQYVNPGETRAVIRKAVKKMIRDSPPVLINTVSGRLLDKSEQAASFESLPVFNKLVSSMTTHIDHARIEHDVNEYYRYAMFSHKWEENEPLFEQVIRTVVYDLEETPTNNKLRMFCKTARDVGLHWAWSDTCCINKADHFVLQEALVSMFKWYQGSALTLVLLLGVRSPSQRGDLVKSIWNSRAWTFQEYHASKVVRFFNEDWTPYLRLDIPNHKESPEILLEMEEVSGISAKALMMLQPGLDDIRKKLHLAAMRQTTLIEDEAYSLLGIFSISMSIVYGEGDQALGRLLSQLLMSSGDTSILAWTGRSGRFNSCLPEKIAVFNKPPLTHIPLAVLDTEMETITTDLRSASLDLRPVVQLYDRLNELPVLLFVGKRMKLPCIVFKLGPVSVSQRRSEQVFRAQTHALGTVEIRTEEDLTRFHSLFLVHPWIDFLLDRQPVGSIFETISENAGELSSVVIGELASFSRSSSLTVAAPRLPTKRIFGLGTSRQRDVVSLLPPSTLDQRDKETLALQVLARLRQPFGALLLTPNLSNVAAYSRVAAESLVTVEEITPAILSRLVDGVRILDVL